MAYATTAQAKTYYAGDDVPGIVLRVAMDISADLVQYYAPSPSPVPPDYARKAQNAELMVGAYIFDSQGYLSGDTVGDAGSSSYLHDGTIFKLISRAMGQYTSAGNMTIRRTVRG